MPSSTYFNLPKEKKDALLKAAIHEFSTVPYHEASINKIIKSANIPRGSFYVYFADKEDLYEYILASHFEKMKEDFIETLKSNHGDIFHTFLDFFDHMILYMENHENKVLTHSFLDMNFRKTRKWQQLDFCLEHREQEVEKLIPYLDMRILSSTLPEDIAVMLDMLFLVLSKNLVDYYIRNITKEEANCLFHQHIALLSKGFRKKEELC